MMLTPYMHNRFWEESISTANYLPTTANIFNKTRLELFYGKILESNKFKLFECTAYAKVHGEKRRKLDVKATKLIFVSYEENSKVLVYYI